MKSKQNNNLRIDGKTHNKPNDCDKLKIDGKINPNSASKELDWKAFLDWSSKYNDGTLKSKVSPEDVKWFEQAMKAMVNSEIDELKKAIMIVDKYRDLEKQPSLKDQIMEALEIIFDIVERGIEQSRDLIKIGMHQVLIQAYFECRDIGIRGQLSIIFNSILQNNNFIKEKFIKENVHDRLFKNLAVQNSPKELEFDISFLNGFVIG